MIIYFLLLFCCSNDIIEYNNGTFELLSIIFNCDAKSSCDNTLLLSADPFDSYCNNLAVL